MYTQDTINLTELYKYWCKGSTRCIFNVFNALFLNCNISAHNDLQHTILFYGPAIIPYANGIKYFLCFYITGYFYFYFIGCCSDRLCRRRVVSSLGR